MRLGLLAILVGIIFLLKNLGLITTLQWSIMWPIILMYVGIATVVRDRCWHCQVWHEGFGKGRGHGSVCDCDCENCGDCKKK